MASAQAGVPGVRAATEWEVVGLMVLAGLAGPLLGYAVLESSPQMAPAIGDPFQAYGANLPGWSQVAAGILGAFSLAAAFIPARRATRLNVQGALRHE